jgi:Holliday junction resolvase-like predicted endonuclease
VPGERNYQPRYGEIDIIACDERILLLPVPKQTSSKELARTGRVALKLFGK